MQDYESRYSGEEVDAILGDVANKVDKVEGKGLSSEDFTFAEKRKLAGLENYDDTDLRKDLATMQNSVVEVRENLDEVTVQVNDINADISDLDAIRRGAGKGDTSVQGVVVNNKQLTPDGKGNISLPKIPAEADIANMGFTKNKGTVTGVMVNGESKSPNSNGVVDLGEIEVDEVKFANDLTGVVEATPEMFTYRPSAGDKSVRDESAVIRRIKGNTSVWGQTISGLNIDSSVKVEKEGDAWVITPMGNTGSPGSVGWGSGRATFNNPHPLNTNHIYLYCVTFTKISKRTGLGDFVVGSTLLSMRGKYIYSDADLGQRTTAVLISKPGASGEIFLSLNDCVTKIENPMLFDLTAIFGAGDEPTTYNEFRKYYPDAYYPYCAPEVRSMRATGIETIGFNAFNGTYAEVIGGHAYYLGGAIEAAYFATERGGEMKPITMPESRVMTFSVSGYIYATGSDICINLSHSGVRNGEYEPYEKNTLLLPEIAKYFSDGMHGIGDVCDEIIDGLAIQRFGEVDLGDLDWSIRTTDESNKYSWGAALSTPSIGTAEIANIVCAKYITASANEVYLLKDRTIAVLSNVLGVSVNIYDSKYTAQTDKDSFVASLQGVKLYYELAEPIYTPIDEILQLAYKVDDFGTERMLSNAPSAPFKADIVYQFNAEGRIRDNSRNIEKLEKLVKQPSDWLEENPNSPAYIKNKPTMPTAIAPVTEVIVEYSLPSILLPNVIHEVAAGLGAFTMPPLYQGDSMTRNVYKMVFVAPEASKITFPYSVKWRDGVAPNWANSGDVVELTFTTMAEVTTILGEWKLYKL